MISVNLLDGRAIYKSHLLHIHMLTMNFIQQIKLRIQFTFTVPSKRIKYLGINLAKEVYTEKLQHIAERN